MSRLEITCELLDDYIITDYIRIIVVDTIITHMVFAP